MDVALADQLTAGGLDIIRLRGVPNLPEAERADLCRRTADFERCGFALITERRREPRDDDMLTTLIAATDRKGNAPLSDEEIFGVIVVMVTGGSDTTAGLAAQMLRRLMTDADLLARVEADRDLLAPLVEEELRHDFVGRLMFRQVREGGTELGGVTLPGGAIVAGHLWSANRDEQAFVDAACHDPDRNFPASG